MEALARLIARSVAGEGAGRGEQAVFGTGDPHTIAEALEHCCRDVLGASVESAVFYETSVGCVAGLRLRGGDEVVLKAHQPRWTLPFLEAVQRTQSALAEGGFPCPVPRSGPVPVLGALVTIEELVADPGTHRATPAMLAVSAGSLARIVALCGDLDRAGLEPHPMDVGGDGLYPEPHSPIFDFAATSDGAGWIDDLARAAREARDVRPSAGVIAHADWSVRNIRMDEHRVLVAYDWDSLAVMPEPVAAGQAAATWSAIDGADPAPTVEEIAAYTRAYEHARGEPFDDAERAELGAAALYVLAYTARCEHAVDPDQAVHRRARPRLAADGDRLLRLADAMAG